MEPETRTVLEKIDDLESENARMRKQIDDLIAERADLKEQVKKTTTALIKARMRLALTARAK